ncbi:MAG: hypothetical protein K5841_06640 [Fretibacterium sp.]|nr:hypothetical protein [Fretibacterium sp.]
MKKEITMKLLKKDYAKKHKAERRMFLFAVIFCLACIALVPERIIGVSVAAVVMGIAFILYTKFKRAGVYGNVNKAYFRLLPMTGKEESRSGDSESGYISTYWLRFGEYGAVEMLKYNDYKNAQEGQLYYVAFYSENDKPFACFDAEKYELPVGQLPRQSGFVTLILAGTLAAIFYYGAVFLLLQGVNAMPPTPPQEEAPTAGGAEVNQP